MLVAASPKSNARPQWMTEEAWASALAARPTGMSLNEWAYLIRINRAPREMLPSEALGVDYSDAPELCQQLRAKVARLRTEPPQVVPSPARMRPARNWWSVTPRYRRRAERDRLVTRGQLRREVRRLRRELEELATLVVPMRRAK